MIKVYIKINGDNDIIAINSEIFIEDLTDWIFIDEGEGDKYAHAQGMYLDKPLYNDEGQPNYAYINGEIVDK